MHALFGLRRPRTRAAYIVLLSLGAVIQHCHSKSARQQCCTLQLTLAVCHKTCLSKTAWCDQASPSYQATRLLGAAHKAAPKMHPTISSMCIRMSCTAPCKGTASPHEHRQPLLANSTQTNTLTAQPYYPTGDLQPNNSQCSGAYVSSGQAAQAAASSTNKKVLCHHRPVLLGAVGSLQ